MTSNANARIGDRIDYRATNGTLAGFTLCTAAAIYGEHDGKWIYHAVRQRDNNTQQSQQD
jgi:hypothetical protein